VAALRRRLRERTIGAASAMIFKDHFSRQAAAYSRYRPDYPAALIDFLAEQSPGRALAIDCATGSGQAAVALARHFDTVLAVDGSPTQLSNAARHPRVHYVAGLAEQLPLPGGRAGLVTAAQAAHWFDFDRFHSECRRVLAPGGVVAAWTYEKFRLDAAVDAVIDHFYEDVVGRYWPRERRYVEEGYRTLPFPWHERPVPRFELQTDWDLSQVLGYVGTWSAVRRYVDDVGADPLPTLEAALEAHWPAGSTRRLHWPIRLRIGTA
jgi:SAM-dependent methyltransferase